MEKLVKTSKDLDPRGYTESKETEVLENDSSVEKSILHITEAGSVVKPLGSTHVGSAVIHFYKTVNGDKAFIDYGTQLVRCDGLGEAQAMFGLQLLAEKFMKAFGHKVPDIRQNMPKRKL